MLRGGAAVRRAGVVVGLVTAVLGTSVGTAHAVTSNGRLCTKVGTPGPDRLIGTRGNDVLCGLGGNDRIFGVDGNDVLDGGVGDDVLLGGPGADVLSGGPGADVSQYDDHTAPVTVVLDGRADDGSVGERDTTRADVEAVLGSRFADTLTGNAGPNKLDGGPGNDRISGLGGNDTLLGSTGDDTLAGGDASDRLLGQLGRDRSDGGNGGDLIEDFSPGDTVTGGAGTDWCHAQVSTSCEVKAGVYTSGPAAIVTGRLRDATGVGVSGASVAFSPFALTTDATGAFSSLVGTTATGLTTVTVTVGDTSWTGSLAVANDKPLDLVLPAERTVTVHVEDQAGAGLPLAEVRFGRSGVAPLSGLTGSEALTYGTTDGYGDLSWRSFRTSVPQADVTYGELRTAPGTLALDPDGRAVVVLDRSPVAVTGTVRDAAGAAVAASVHITSGSVTGDVTDAGAFALSALRAPQTLTVATFNRAGLPRDLVLSTPLGTPAGDTVADLTLPPVATQVVRAVDGAGAPVPGVTVGASTYPSQLVLDGRTWTVRQSFDTLVTDSAGEVRFPVLGTPSTSYGLSVSRPGASLSASGTTTFGGPPVVVAFEARTGALSGAVRAGTQPVAGAQVSAGTSAAGYGYATTTAANDGTYALDAWFGTNTLGFSGTVPGVANFNVNLSRQVDGPQALDLDLGEATGLTLTLVDSNGAPWADRPVSAQVNGTLAVAGATYSYQNGGLPPDARTDAAGKVVVPALPGVVSGSISVQGGDGYWRSTSLYQLDASSSLTLKVG